MFLQFLMKFDFLLDGNYVHVVLMQKCGELLSF